jgi:hypothetical protein
MKPVLFALLLMPAFAVAQNHVLYLKNGEKIEAQTIRYRNPIFGKERLILGEKKYYMDQLDSFRIFKISYLSKQIRGKGRYISVRPLIQGKINLYDHSRPPRTETIAGLMPQQLVMGVPMIEHKDLPLNWYRHGRFVRLMKENDQALASFREARKIHTISILSNTVALGLMTAGIIANPAESKLANGLFYGGLSVSLASSIYDLSTSDRYLSGLYDAIKKYNQ